MAHVVCFAVGSYLQRWRACIDTQRKYCEKYNHQYHLITEPYGELHPKWQKFDYVKRLLCEESGHVFLIDADAEITDIAPDFSELVEKLPEFDIFSVLGRSKRPNSGVVLFRDSKDSCATKFLIDCIENRGMRVPAQDFVTPEGENGHFIYFLRQEAYRGKAHTLPRSWNNTLPPPRSEDFVIHYNAGPMRDYLNSRP
jgi:hypothetical protein